MLDSRTVSGYAGYWQSGTRQPVVATNHMGGTMETVPNAHTVLAGRTLTQLHGDLVEAASRPYTYSVAAAVRTIIDHIEATFPAAAVAAWDRIDAGSADTFHDALHQTMRAGK